MTALSQNDFVDFVEGSSGAPKMQGHTRKGVEEEADDEDNRCVIFISLSLSLSSSYKYKYTKISSNNRDHQVYWMNR